MIVSAGVVNHRWSCDVSELEEKVNKVATTAIVSSRELHSSPMHGSENTVGR